MSGRGIALPADASARGIALTADAKQGGRSTESSSARRRKAPPHRAEARCHPHDRPLVEAICRWFAAAGRDLPWRAEPGGPGGGRDPYRSLVSEAMLQQTQVSRVLERFEPFLERFPTVQALAEADEQAVLAAWTGLGYYRRARLLHAAAKAIVSEHGGRLPRDVARLRRLPGVGRYTAGAIASICFGEAAPIVDGNVARVLLRIEGREGAAGERETDAWLWELAGDLVEVAAMGGPSLRDEPGGPSLRDGSGAGSLLERQAAEGDLEGRPPRSVGPPTDPPRSAGPPEEPLVAPGPFNEGLMELGATVCPPRAPRCGVCPVAPMCKARATGAQDRIPAPKRAAERQVIRCAAVIVTDGRGRVLVDRRPGGGGAAVGAGGGRWAGMWQAPTLEVAGEGRGPGRVRIVRWLGEAGSLGASAELAEVERFEFLATHRRLVFRVWRAGRVDARVARRLVGAAGARGAVESRWVERGELGGLAMSSPQRRLLGVLKDEG